MRRVTDLFWFVVKLTLRVQLKPHREQAALNVALVFHCQTAGYSTEILNKIFSFKTIYNAYPRVGRKVSDDSGISNGIEPHEISEIIKSEGYSVASAKLSKRTVDELLRIEPLLRGSLTLANGNQVSDVSLDSASEMGSPLRLNYYSDSLLRHKVVKDLASSVVLSNVANTYLKGAYLDSVAMWRSFACYDVSAVGLKEAAQAYHFDFERLAWLKVFVYLTDVDEQSGPHVYVPGSHSPNFNKFSLLQKGYERIADEEIERIYGSDSPKTITGRAGTVFFGDTKAFHKGTSPKASDRVVFELQYANNSFGHCPIEIPKGIKNELFRRD